MKKEPPDRPPNHVLASPRRAEKRGPEHAGEMWRRAGLAAGTRSSSFPYLLLVTALHVLLACLSVHTSAAMALSDHAMSFDGTAFSYTRTDAVPFGGAFAVSFWLYLSNATGSTPNAILHLGNGNGRDEALIDVDEVSGKLRLYIRNGDGYTQQLPGHLCNLDSTGSCTPYGREAVCRCTARHRKSRRCAADKRVRAVYRKRCKDDHAGAR